MFGNSNGGSAPPPGDDTQDGPAMPIPEVPPYRTYRIRARTANGTIMLLLGRDSKLHDELVIQGHEVESNAAGMGNVFRVREYVMHPNLGPISRCVLGLFKPADAWLEYTEELPEPVEASRIIMPGDSVGGVH